MPEAVLTGWMGLAIGTYTLTGFGWVSASLASLGVWGYVRQDAGRKGRGAQRIHGRPEPPAWLESRERLIRVRLVLTSSGLFLLVIAPLAYLAVRRVTGATRIAEVAAASIAAIAVLLVLSGRAVSRILWQRWLTLSEEDYVRQAAEKASYGEALAVHERYAAGLPALLAGMAEGFRANKSLEAQLGLVAQELKGEEPLVLVNAVRAGRAGIVAVTPSRLICALPGRRVVPLSEVTHVHRGENLIVRVSIGSEEMSFHILDGRWKDFRRAVMPAACCQDADEAAGRQ